MSELPEQKDDEVYNVTWRSDKQQLTVKLKDGGRHVFGGVKKIFIDDGVCDTPGSIVALSAAEHVSIPKELGSITYEYIAGTPVAEEEAGR